MIRKLKVLGMSLAMVFAINAVLASAASAVGKFTSDGPVTLTIEETGTPGSGANAFTTFSEKAECPGTIYTGHKIEITPHEPISNSATTATITPHYANCSSGGLPITVDMNGCDYVLHLGEIVSEHTFRVTADIVCPAGKHIQLTTFSSGSHALKVCTDTITPANGLSGPHISTNTVAHDLTLKGTFTGITVHKSGLCGTSTDKEAKIDLHLTVTGKNNAGETTGVTVTN